MMNGSKINEPTYRLSADQEPRARVLERLAREAGFELKIKTLRSERISLELRDVTAEQALARILPDVPYSLEYTPAKRGEASALSRVRVDPKRRIFGRPSKSIPLAIVPGATPVDAPSQGSPLEADARDPEWAGGEGRGDRGSASRAGDTGNANEADPTGRAEPRSSEPPASGRETDPSVIAKRVNRIHLLDALDAEELPQILEILAGDTTSAYRAAAAEQLSDSESPESIHGLIMALGDPDSAVVLNAIASLEFVGDESTAGSFQPLLRHSDREVREAAEAAIEFLE